MAPEDSGFYLTEEEQLLIQAATLPEEEALAAWETWYDRVELDAVAPASFAILPAVARNLEGLAGAYPHASRLRGVRRHAWTQNQVTLRDLVTVYQTLRDARIPAIGHRGLPLAQRYLGDLSTVTCDQVDLLIAPADLDNAATLLGGLGWRSASPLPPVLIRPVVSAHAFAEAGRRRVVLHWRALPHGCSQDVEHQVRERAQPTMLGLVAVPVPGPEDAMLIAAARLPGLHAVERMRWALETVMICRTVVDWDSIARQASLAGLPDESVTFMRTLTAALTGPLPIPAGTLPTQPAAAGASPPSGMLSRLARASRATWSRYRVACRTTGQAGTPWGLASFAVAFYRREWQIPAGAGIPSAAIRQLWTSPSDGGHTPSETTPVPKP